MDIIVPQCCKEWANVTIGYTDDKRRYQYKNRSVSRKIRLPEFEIEPGSKGFGEMDFSIYQRYAEENKDAILALVERLNAPESSVIARKKSQAKIKRGASKRRGA
jgi:hypothetical protein